MARRVREFRWQPGLACAAAVATVGDTRSAPRATVKFAVMSGDGHALPGIAITLNETERVSAVTAGATVLTPGEEYEIRRDGYAVTVLATRAWPGEPLPTEIWIDRVMPYAGTAPRLVGVV